MKRKLFAIAFFTAFILTSFLCMITGQPLIFLPVDYGVTEFVKFGLLVGLLSFLLVFINLPVLGRIHQSFRINVREEGYYIIGTMIILQVVTLTTGYLESGLSLLGGADFFYYYRGAGNSHLYIIAGNFTSAIIASLYAKQQVTRKKTTDTGFDFDPDSERRD